jgi:hypothetical protein
MIPLRGICGYEIHAYKVYTLGVHLYVESAPNRVNAEGDCEWNLIAES